MGFHITQPGSSIATSLINTEANPKHALFLEIKVSTGATCYTNIQISSFLIYLVYHVALE